MADTQSVVLRTDVIPDDLARVEVIVRSADVFRDDEVAAALEPFRESLRMGAASGYEFVLAELAGEVVGYACYGPIPCTVHSWDLYWIATREDHMRCGLGRRMMEAVESSIAERGGTRIYVETSSTEVFGPTRAFYERCGYAVEAVLDDYYAPGDGMVILLKRLG